MIRQLDLMQAGLEAQIARVARQAAHNAVDQDAALAVVEHKLEKKIDALEERVSKLEHDNGG